MSVLMMKVVLCIYLRTLAEKDGSIGLTAEKEEHSRDLNERAQAQLAASTNVSPRSIRFNNSNN